MEEAVQLNEQLVCRYELCIGYDKMYPSYNTFQICNGSCMVIVANSVSLFRILCEKLIPILQKYYAPFSITNPLKKSNSGDLTITIFEGDWDKEQYIKELCMRADLSLGLGFLTIEQYRYQIKYLTYTNYDIVSY